MSKQEYDTHLKYGQGIIIEGFKTDGYDTGYLTAQGFADIKVKYQTCEDILFFKNYRNSLFQILPAGNFELNDQLQKALIQNQGNEDTANIKILRDRADSQKYQFELNIFNHMKKKICFGAGVIFKHIDSQSYVSGTIKPSTGSNGAFTVQVSQKLSDSLVFKLLPYRSFEFNDMAIPFQSPIIIKNQFNNGFMTFEKIGMADSSNTKGTYINKKPIDSNQTYEIPVKTPSLTSDQYEVVTHFVDLSVEKEVPMPWRFKLHVNNVENDILVQHDVVFLQHTENAGILATSGKNIILKELKERQNQELAFYDCLWEIQKHNATDEAYILRHLMSGMILGQEVVEGKRVGVLLDISEGKPAEGQISYLEVKLAKKEGGQINSESFVNIVWQQQLLEIDSDIQGLANSANKSRDPSARVDLNKMKHIYNRNIEYNIKPLVFRKSVAQEHCFTIMEIPDDLKEQLLFALSFHSVIIRLRQDLKFGAIQAAKKISYLRMMQVTSKIRQIKRFIKNCSEEEAELQHFFPQTKRQMICKDLGISELLFELLYFMKMNLREDIFSDQHNQRQKFMQLYNTLYEVNRQLIRHNYLFKMHVSKWFQFILNDVIAGDVPCQLALLKELLDNNQFFTANFVNQDIVAFLTTHFTAKGESIQFTEKKYLQIFRLFCVSGINVNTNNQKVIVDFFLKKIQGVGSVFEVKLEEMEGGIMVVASLDKQKQAVLPFGQFYAESQNSNPSAWLYFVEYLNLMADLTQGRNKITELEVSKIFSLQVLSDLFENQELHEAQIPIIRLLHYLYAESEQFYPIEKRRRLLNYNDLAGGEGISVNSTNSVIKPWQPPLDRILLRLLSRIKSFGAIETRDQNNTEQGIASAYFNNRVLQTLLQFLWETVNLGFWNNKESAKDILSNVLLICKKGEFINYEEARIQSKENLVMIQCKIQCLNIIQLIAYIDSDVFVQNIAAKFKDLEFVPKKFDLKGMLGSNLMEIKCDDPLIQEFLPSIPTEEAIQPIIQTSICDQMVELTNYRNPQLTSGALSIIDLALQTKKKAFQQFHELIIISEQERVKLVEFMEVHRNKLFLLDDTNTVGVNDDNQICNYFMVSEPGNMGLMEVLYLLTELMKNENSILEVDRIRSIHDTGVFDALGSNRLVNFTGERSSTNRMKQQIIYSSNLYKKVLNFIFNCKQIPQETLSLKLLHMCYYFIVALIQNYNQIKAQMQWHIPKLIHHIERNVGCIDFLKQMYDNNKTMLYNEPQVFELIKVICENIEKEPQQSFYKSKLLDFFRYLIYCNGRCLRTHQIQILKIMQDDSYANIMASTAQEVTPLIDQYEKDNQASEEVIMGPRLTYLCNFFQLMSSLIDNSNSVNIGKLIKRYPFDYLVGLIEGARSCWPLKRNIRALINRLYYFQKGIDIYLKPIISRELPSLASDFHQYIKSKYHPNTEVEQNKKFKDPVRFSYIQSYRYLLIEESFFSLMSLSNESILAQLTKYLNKNAATDLNASYNIFKLLERMGWLQVYFTNNKNTYSNSMIKYLISKLKPLLESLEDPAIYVLYGDISSPDNKAEIINKIICGNIGKFYEEHSAELDKAEPLSYMIEIPVKPKIEGLARDEGRLKEILRDIFRREKKDFQNQDERISYNLQQLISSLKLSISVHNYFRSEYLEKVDTYYKRKNNLKFIKRIIALNSCKPGALSADQKIFFLQYIIGYIEAGNQSIPQPQEGEPRLQIDQWGADDWKDSKASVDKIQINLKKRDLGKFLVDLLKEDITVNIELANSILLCAIAYLLGGNAITQKNILEELQKDEENKVFANIESLIFILGKLIRKNIDEANTQKDEASAQSSEFSPDRIDNYDFFDTKQKYTMRKNVSEPNSTDEFIYNKLCITTYRRAFKFLQIMCENNNIDNKNLIRKQEGKVRQFNFIEITTKELRSLFQIYCQEIKVVPLYLLDFILEVTQIPVYQNQSALMNSTFFQDLCQLKSSFTFNEPELLIKKLNQTNFQNMDDVNEIFYISFKIILSNFQGNDKRTYIALDNKLQSKFLLQVLKQKLSKMGIESDKQLTAYIQNYNNQEDEEGNKNTGFDDDMLIVLDVITIYLKMKNADEDIFQGSSRLMKGYNKFKKDLRDAQRERILQLVNDKVEADIEDRDKVVEQKTEKKMKKSKCMYGHLQQLLINIDVTDEKGQIQMVFFPNFPVFSSLTANLRDQIMLQVNRDSHREKIVSLLSYTDGVKEKIEYSYNLQKKDGITESNMNDSFKVAAILSILICIFITYFYQISVQYKQAQYYTSYPLRITRFALSFMQLIFSILFMFYWYKLKLWKNPQTINRGQQSAEVEAQETDAAGQEEKEEDQEADLGPVAIQIQAEGQEKGEAEQPEADAPVQAEEVPIWKKHLPVIVLGWLQKVTVVKQKLMQQLESEQQRIYKSSQFWRHGVFVMASFVGTFYFPPMFFLHLIIIFARIEKLGTILVSAVYNIKSLLYMAALGIVFTYVFNTVTFSNYMKNVYAPSDQVGDMCDSVMGCVSQLYVSGAIGETMQEFEIVRFSYDMVYFIFFEMMFGNIVSGLMLDAFSSLREEAEARDTDKADFCYMCDVKRQTLGGMNLDFNFHINKLHFLWNYVFYIYVLERKDETDYTGLQYVIKNQYYKSDDQMEVSWIPNLGQSEFDIKSSTEAITEIVSGQLEAIRQNKSTLDDSVSQFKAIARDFVGQ